MPSWILIAVFGSTVAMLIGWMMWIKLPKRKPKTPKPMALPAAAGAEGARGAAPAAGGDKAPADPYFSASRLRKSFARTVRALKSRVAGRDYRYQIPWVVMIGQAGSGKSTLVQDTGLRPIVDRSGEEKADLDWWFFDQGIILDVPGRYVLGPEGERVDSRPWDTLLGLLLKHRPQRPLDGMVLTIPWSELQGKPDLFRLRRAAEQMYEKLWSAQRRLGMNFPVYVLVTKADKAPGFKEFCQALPETMRDDAFGWSSPYALSAAFSPEWVDEAFVSLTDTIERVQLELFAEGREIRDEDPFFLFPSEFASIREPLRFFLGALFKNTVYHESFFFRGLFFSGDGTTERVAGQLVSNEPGPGGGEAEGGGRLVDDEEEPIGQARQPWFVNRFLEEKVFREFGLARPALGAFLSRNRTVMASQIAMLLIALLGGLYLWRAGRSLGNYRETLVPPLLELGRDVEEQRAERTADGAPTRESYVQGTADLTRAIDRERDGDATYLGIPTSWFGDVDERVDEGLAVGYSKLLLSPLHHRLVQRARELTRPAEGATAIEPGSATVASFETAPELDELGGYLDRLAALESAALLYRRLPASNDAESLRRVVDYAYSIDLPPELAAADEVREKAMRVSPPPPFELDEFKADASRAVVARAWRLYERVYEHNMVVDLLERLSERIRDERLYGSGPAGAGPGGAEFGELLDLIVRTRQVLGRDDLRWLAQDELKPGDAFGKMLERIGSSSLLGPQVRAEIEAEGRARFRALRGRLRELRTRQTDALLEERDGRLVLQLGPGVEAFRGALENLLAQPFMTETPRYAIEQELGPGHVITWDPALLRRAADMVEAYERFRSEGIRGFPAQLEPTVARIATERLEANLGNSVARALRVETRGGIAGGVGLEDEVAARVRSLQDAAPALGKLVGAAERWSLAELAEALRTIVQFQASDLLRAADLLLERADPYAVGEVRLGWWEGRQPAAFGLFDVADKGELQTYLDVQRQLVARIARSYVQPVLSLLGATQPEARYETPVVAKWQKILTALDRHEKMAPGNSVSGLEQFVAKDLAELTLGNCLALPQGGGTPERADLFERKEAELRRQVRSRCIDLAEAGARRAYNDLASRFNRELGGSFPFSEVSDAGAAPPAVPGAIRAFFEHHDRFASQYRAALEASERLAATRYPAIEFLDRMAQVRAFFAPFLDAESKEAPPVYDVAVEFRVNREHETGGDRIIEWAFRAGPNRLEAGVPAAQVRWTMGDPVAVTLRWAKDGPTWPMPGGPARVDPLERTASFVHSGGWALIELVRARRVRPSDLDRPAEAGRTVVGFVVPVRTLDPEARDGNRKQDGAEEKPTGEARVYLRVSILPPDGKAPLEVPSFPVHAPVLPEPAAGTEAASEGVARHGEP